MVGACYAGRPRDGVDVVRPLKEFGNPFADLLEPKPYLALQSMFDPFVPHGWHRYWKAVELPPLTVALGRVAIAATTLLLISRGGL